MLFTMDEYQNRIAAARVLMAEYELNYLIVLDPENVTYLTGFFTEGYPMSYQFALLTQDQDPVVVTRIVEKYWAERSSAYPEATQYWTDGEEPEGITTRVLKEHGVTGRVGIEMGSWRANARVVAAITAEFSGISLVDVGVNLSRIRFVKSTAELDLMRQAGNITTRMMQVAVDAIRPGRTERAITAEIASAAIQFGSDWTFPGAISSGPAAREIHAPYSDRIIEDDDLLFTEIMAHVHHYHARFMRSVVVGEPSEGFVDLARRVIEIQDEALAVVRAGVSCRVPDRICREGVAATGLVESYPNKTFYGVGLLLDPNTLEPQQVDRTTDFQFEAGSTWHAYLTVAGINISETIVVTESGYERLTTYPRELIMV
ncbi:M24 family metallopeptidase [Rhodococcus sp. NPDC055024]